MEEDEEEEEKKDKFEAGDAIDTAHMKRKMFRKAPTSLNIKRLMTISLK